MHADRDSHLDNPNIPSRLKNTSKFIFFYLLHAYIFYFIILFLLFIYFYFYFYFFISWVGSNPTHMGAGLDPASPARSLAQASDLAGLSQRHA
jgi:hypothetical protein